MAVGDVRSLVLGPYHLLEEVGRGGMGRVYKALHTVMGRIVALKLMAPELAENERSRERFLREVRSVTRLQHPNIVLAHDANDVEGVLFLVMEYVEGTTLAELVRVGGPLPVSRACELMRQAALGLQHAFQKGLVHRDIKPANLLIPRLSPAETPTCAAPGAAVLPQSTALVKIADFGLARLLGGDTVAGHTATGFLGTPDYVAPEQCQDGRSADIRSDLYSLGCTFHFALTGRVPFAGDSVMEKLYAHVMTPPPSMEALRPDVPAEVAAIVARLMAKGPDERFQTPAQLALAVAPSCAEGGPGPVPAAREGRLSAADTTRVVEQGALPGRRRRTWSSPPSLAWSSSGTPTSRRLSGSFWPALRRRPPPFPGTPAQNRPLRGAAPDAGARHRRANPWGTPGRPGSASSTTCARAGTVCLDGDGVSGSAPGAAGGVRARTPGGRVRKTGRVWSSSRN